jgi:class 3 adenylate cyclase/tetratricopeptide (TPR) repeat protein
MPANSVMGHRMEDIKGWLRSIKLGQYEEAFERYGLTFKQLPTLRDEDLTQLGVVSIEHRQQIFRSVRERFGQATLHTQKSGKMRRKMQGERRDVTVLFIDLSDFTSISSELGPEGTHALVTQFYAICDEVILDHGGTIDKHIGDEVMALFGAPVAHPDDPFRAVLCANEVQSAMQSLSYKIGIDIKVHIGLAHGEVIASSVGHGAREYTVIGDTVNLAARLKGIAQAGETVISSELKAFVDHRFSSASLGFQNIRGIKHHVEPWLLTPHPHNHGAPSAVVFINRKAELAKLRSVLIAASKDKIGSLVTINGDLGIGKTRLVNEFQRHAAKLDYLVIQESLLETGAQSGISSLGQVLGSLLKTSVGSEAAKAASRMDHLVKAGILTADDIEIINLIYTNDNQTDRTNYLSSMTFDSFHTKVSNIFVKLIGRILDQQPVILIVENLRPDQIDVLMPLWEVATSFSQRQLIIIVTSRRAETFASWWQDTRQVNLVDLQLGPFSSLDSVKLFESVKPESDHNAVETIIDAAGGNPFIISLLAEQGIDVVEGEASPTVRNLVLSKIDRLPMSDRWGLICASVLGEYFELEHLKVLSDTPEMDCNSYIRNKLVIPFRVGFRFISNMVREVVYEMLLGDQRRHLHAAAAKMFKDTNSDLFACHLDQADDTHAFAAYIEAAKRNMHAFQYPGAIQNLESALASKTAPQSPFQAMLLLAKCQRGIGNVSAASDTLTQAIERAGTKEDSFQAQLLNARLEMEKDRYQPALQALARCEQIAQNLGSDEKLAKVFSQRGSVLLPMDEPRKALIEHERALEFVRMDASGATQIRVLRGAGLGHYHVGRMQTAHECFDKVVRAADQVEDLWAAANTLNFRGHTKYWLGDLPGAASDAERAIADAERLGEVRAQMNAHRLAALVELELQNPATARKHAEMSLQLTDRLDAWRYRTLVLGLICKSAILENDKATATTFAEQALAEIDEADNRYNGPITLGLVARAFEDPAKRRSVLEDSSRRLRDNTIAHNHLWFYTDAIEISLESGELKDALRYAEKLGAVTQSSPVPLADLYIHSVDLVSKSVGSASSADDKKQLREHLQSLSTQKILSLKHALESFLCINSL